MKADNCDVEFSYLSILKSKVLEKWENNNLAKKALEGKKHELYEKQGKCFDEIERRNIRRELSDIRKGMNIYGGKVEAYQTCLRLIKELEGGVVDV